MTKILNSKFIIQKVGKRLIITILALVIIGAPLLYLSLLNAPTTKAAWFDDNWAYRKAITVTISSSSADITNLQTLITVDTSTSMSGKIQSACQDLRFTSVSGKLLPYYIDSGCGTSSTKVWVMLDLVPKNTTTYTLYMYYGNPTAVAGSDVNKFNLFNGLVGYWTTNESSWNGTSGEVKDSSISGNNGTASGDATTTSSGKLANGGTFDGNGDFVTLTSAPTTGTGSFSIFAWIKTSDTGARKQITMWGNDAGQTDDGAWFFINTSNQVEFDLSNRAGPNSTTTVTDGNWHFVAAVNNAGTVQIYVDGQANGSSASMSPNLGSTYKVISKRGSNGTWFFNGQIDDIHVYNRALSTFEISQLYSNPGTIATTATGTSLPSTSFATEETNNGANPGPIAYWKFDEGTGTTAYDSTSHGYNGTLSGSTLPTWQTEDQCISGKCLSFDGSNASFAATDKVLNTSDFSVSLWVKNLSATQALDTTIISNQNDTNNYGFVFANRTSNGNGWNFFYGTGSGSWIGIDLDKFSLTANQWTHVVFTKSGANTVIYVNGVVQASRTQSSATVSFTNSNTMRLASSPASAIRKFNGMLDDVKFYNYARSAAQVTTDYNSRGSVKGAAANLGNIATNVGVGNSAPIAYYNFDEASGTSAQDRSGNSYTGTWNGTGAKHWLPGKYGSSGNFNGTNDYVSSTLSQAPSTYTVSFWAKDSGSNTWHYYTNSNGTQYVDGVASSFTNKYYYLQGSILYMGGAGIQPNDSSISSNLALWLKADAITGKNDGNAISSWADSSSLGYSAIQNTANKQPLYKTNQINSLPVVRLDGSNDDLTVASFALTTFSTVFVVGKFTLAAPSFIEHGPNFNTNDGMIAYNFRFPGVRRTTLNAGPNSDVQTSSSFAIASYIYDGVLVGATTNRGRGYLNGVISNEASGPAGYQANPANTTVTDTLNIGSRNGASLFSNGDYAEIIVYNRALTTTEQQNIETYLSGKYNISVASTSLTYYPGQIDDFKVYNYARTQQQVVQDMNANHPPPGGALGSAIGYWKFDEGFGTTANNSGSQGLTLQGTLTNMSSPATSTSGWTNAGKFNKALIFDGSNDYVSMGNNSSLQNSNGTITAWINTSNAGTSYRGIVVKQNAYGMFLKDNVFMMYDWGAATDRSSGVNLGDGNWHHVACSFQSAVTNGTLCYIDGNLRLTTTITVSDQTKALFVGFGNSGSQYFTGTIDEAKVYNYVLTADQIKLDMNRSQAQVLGATSDNSSYQKQAANQDYCVPGDTTSCTSPIGEWKFDEHSGSTVNDSSGNNNTGTWNGTLGSQWTRGKLGSAGNFNGSNNYVDSGSNSSLQITGSSMTTEAWVKTSNNQGGIILRTTTSNPWQGWGMAVGGNLTNGKLAFWYGNSSNWDFSTSTVNDGKWHHVAVTFDSSNSYFYIDGKLDATVAKTGTVALSSSSVSTYIGTDGSNGTPGAFRDFNGQIDQVRVFNYARSAAQVAWDYNRGGPIGLWKFDECQGSIVHDSSLNANGDTNNNNGTITIGSGGTQTSTTNMGTCSDNPATTTPWSNGKTGKYNASLNFDGTDDYVTVSNNSAFQSDAATYSVWIKPSSTINNTGQGGNDVSFLRKQVSGAGYILEVYGTSASNKQLSFWTNYPAGVSSTQTLTSGNWYHIVGTYDGSTAKLYLNGVQIASNTDTSTGSNTTPIDFAQFNSNGAGTRNRFFGGQMDDARIYNYALTSTQVQTLYNGGFAVRYGPVTGTP